MSKTFMMTVAAAAASMHAAAPAEWVEASSKHFQVYGDMSQAQAKEWAERLERVDHFLRQTAGAKDEESVGKVTIYVVPSMETVQRLAGARSVGGFYRASVQGDLAVTPRKIPSEYRIKPDEVLFHEYTHHILIRSESETVPGWIHEAFAEFFSTLDLDKQGTLTLGEPLDMRGYTLVQQYRMTIEELLTSGNRTMSPDEVPHMYARGWLLVHYLTMSKKRPGQLGKYLALVKRGTPSLAAGKQAFGDLRKLDGELITYQRTGRFPIARIPAARYAVGPIQTRSLTECQSRIMPVRIRSAVGVTKKTAPAVAADARRAAIGCERDVFVQRTIAETEFDAGDNAAAMAAADRALAADPQNIMALLYKGRVYARQKNWTEARKFFVRANRMEPNFGLPLVLYYDSFVRAGQQPTEAALTGLLRAAVLVPQDDEVRMRVVRALVSRGDLAGARAVIAPLAFAPHQDAESDAGKIYALLQSGDDAKTVLAAVDKAKWNEVGNE